MSYSSWQIRVVGFTMLFGFLAGTGMFVVALTYWHDPQNFWIFWFLAVVHFFGGTWSAHFGGQMILSRESK